MNIDYLKRLTTSVQVCGVGWPEVAALGHHQCWVAMVAMQALEAYTSQSGGASISWAAIAKVCAQQPRLLSCAACLGGVGTPRMLAGLNVAPCGLECMHAVPHCAPG